MATLSGLINNKTVDICIEDVKNIDNFEDVMNWASELDVDLGELNSLEEMKERLVMTLEKSQSDYVNFKTRVGFSFFFIILYMCRSLCSSQMYCPMTINWMMSSLSIFDK